MLSLQMRTNKRRNVLIIISCSLNSLFLRFLNSDEFSLICRGKIFLVALSTHGIFIMEPFSMSTIEFKDSVVILLVTLYQLQLLILSDRLLDLLDHRFIFSSE